MSNGPLLKAQPILDYIERRGGMFSLPYPIAERNGQDPALDPDVIEEWAEVLRQRLKAIQQRSTERGGELAISLHSADAICIDFLGAHPWEVYGNDWFRIDEDDCAILANRTKNEKRKAA